MNETTKKVDAWLKKSPMYMLSLGSYPSQNGALATANKIINDAVANGAISEAEKKDVDRKVFADMISNIFCV